MSRYLRTRLAGACVALAALLAGTFTATAHADSGTPAHRSAHGARSVEATFSEPVRTELRGAAAPSAVSCSVNGVLSLTRFSACYHGTFVVLVRDVETREIVGAAEGTVKYQTQLDNRSRTKWSQSVSLTTTNVEGEAWLLLASMTIDCGHCTVAGGGERYQGYRASNTWDFTLSSPGTATVRDPQAPKVTFTVPLPGASSSTVLIGHALTVRCDNTPRMSPVKFGGCVFSDVTPTYNISTTDPNATVDQVAWHIWWAQQNLHNHWGWHGHGPYLTRILGNQKLIDKNRDVACAGAPNPRPPGESCDEYPFASTYQGASLNADFSCHMVPGDVNSTEGRVRKRWYNQYRVLDGDPFWVHVILPRGGAAQAPPQYQGVRPLVTCPGF